MHHKEENDHDNTETSFNWKNDYPCRVEGWLNIWGYNAQEYDDQSLSECYPEFPDWQPRYCVLLQNIRKFYYYSSEEENKSSKHDGPKLETKLLWCLPTLQ